MNPKSADLSEWNMVNLKGVQFSLTVSTAQKRHEFRFMTVHQKFSNRWKSSYYSLRSSLLGFLLSQYLRVWIQVPAIAGTVSSVSVPYWSGGRIQTIATADWGRSLQYCYSSFFVVILSARLESKTNVNKWKKFLLRNCSKKKKIPRVGRIGYYCYGRASKASKGYVSLFLYRGISGKEGFLWYFVS